MDVTSVNSRQCQKKLKNSDADHEKSLIGPHACTFHQQTLMEKVPKDAISFYQTSNASIYYLT